MVNKFERAINLIDEINQDDPNVEIHNGEKIPKELLYSERMTEHLQDFHPEASDELKIAARAQHIARWKIDRSEYPQNRIGYIKWRNELKKMHAEITSEILQTVGYEKEFIDRVSFLIRKKQIKKDHESQALEDVICLVFLQYYLEDFTKKHPEDKLVDIIQKTWAKMSSKGHEFATKITFSQECKRLIEKAIM